MTILRARVVITMDGAPIENGAVAISGGRIADVGTFPEIKARYASSARTEIVDLGERALLPGFINAHCHLDYTCLRGKIARQKSFTDWVRAINAAKARLTADDYVASINEGFAEARQFGTTTIANLTAFPELISRITAPIRTFWFPELIDVRNSGELNLFGLTEQVRELSSDGEWGLAPHALFTASAGLYRRCTDVAPILTTHLAESREEMEMFRDARGELYDFLKEIGRDMSDCGGTTPLQRFFSITDPSVRAGDANSPGMTTEWILAHLNELAESDFDLLAGSNREFTIVHCPRSHAYFDHSPFQFEKLRGLGFNVCLGTDSLASNDDLSLFAEMREFQKKFPSISSLEILSMVTFNPARALGRVLDFGCIRPEACADCMAIPVTKSGKAVFDEVIAFNGKPWTMLAGKIIG